MNITLWKKFYTTMLMLITFICLSGFVTLNGCHPQTPTITATLGPENQKLFNDQKIEIGDLKSIINQNKITFDKIAGNSYGISLGVQHIDGVSKGKDIVVAENTLIKEVVGDPTPETRASADARTISVLKGDLAEQQRLYGLAKTDIDNNKKQIDEKERVIKDRDDKLVEQELAAKNERDTNKKKMDDTIISYDNQIKKIKDEQAAKEHQMWINTVRGVGVFFLILGVLAIAITEGKALIQGSILAGSGILIIGIGMAFDIVTSQWWFPYAAFILGLIILIGIGWFIWHLYQTHQLAKRSTAVLNDIKTEAETLSEKGIQEGKDTLAKIQPHLEYRFGQATSFWHRSLQNSFIQNGLDAKTK